MHMPSITPEYLTLLAVACAALALQMIRLPRSSCTVFNGGILLALGLSTACALPMLSRLPWAEVIDEASDQAIAVFHFLEVTYIILTL